MANHAKASLWKVPGCLKHKMRSLPLDQMTDKQDCEWRVIPFRRRQEQVRIDSYRYGEVRFQAIQVE